MDTFKSLEEDLYHVNTSNFNDFAIRLFRYQQQHNPVYQQYLTYLGRDYSGISHYSQVPFMPISFFKGHTIMTGRWQPQKIFTSSGTTGVITSRHVVKDEQFYLRHAELIFNSFFGPITDYHVLALLPSYLEREGSSLIDMVNYFIQVSGSTHSGFYLYNRKELIEKLQSLKGQSRKVLLLGVTFALLDLAEEFPCDLSHCMIMETGGMKGRRKELTRSEVHDLLKSSFNIQQVYSEYGMTELLSQAYSQGEGVFQCPIWMKILLRDPEDALDVSENRASGAINVIDLANIHSCAFIETQDLGKKTSHGYFEVLGRMDNADIRGCNLLVG